LPASFLKQSDEQTVVGLAAVYRALAAPGVEPAGLAAWGIVAAPRFIGWTTLTAALQRFAEEGAWGTSPHLIPHRSLHALSGTVSQALGVYGPNFGVGGGPSAADEALLVAGALLSAERLPGLWVVLTDFTPDDSELSAPDLTWHGVALALLPGRPEGTGPWLEIGVPGAGTPPLDGERFTLASLAAALAAPRAGEATWRLGCGGWARLNLTATRGEERP
jgi:hypothetical protein